MIQIDFISSVAVHSSQPTTVPAQTTTPGEEASITESPEPPDDEPKGMINLKVREKNASH